MLRGPWESTGQCGRKGARKFADVRDESFLGPPCSALSPFWGRVPLLRSTTDKKWVPFFYPPYCRTWEDLLVSQLMKTTTLLGLPHKKKEDTSPLKKIGEVGSA